MEPQSVFPALTRRLAWRDRMRRRLREGLWLAGTALGLGLLAYVVQRLLWPGLPLGAVCGALAVALVAAWAWVWTRAREDLPHLLLAADREYRSEEQLSTAFELQRQAPQHPFLPALLARCEALAQRVDPKRLVPFSLATRDYAAGAFVLAALALLLVPPDWARTTQAETPRNDPTVVETGLRLEKLAERLEEIAQREAFQRLQELTAHMKRLGDELQNQLLSPEEAAERLNELAETAQALAAAVGSGQGEAPPDANSTERSLESGAPARETDEAGDDEATPDNEAAETLITGRRERDAVGDEARSDGKQPQGEDAYENPENEATRIADDKGGDESKMLKRARQHMQEMSSHVQQEFNSPDEEVTNQMRHAMKNSQGDMSNPKSAPSSGNERPKMDAESSISEGGGSEAPDYEGDIGYEDQNQSEAGPTDAPGDVAYEDVYLEDENPEAGAADERWVRQLPTLNASQVKVEGRLPTFQRNSVAAQGGSAVPRAYRDVVRNYFVELDAQNAGAR